jgi:hypothetical protein
VSDRIKPGQRQRWPDALYDRAEALLNSPAGRPTATQIATHLAEEFPDVPQPGAIREWIEKGIIKYEPTEPWTFVDSDPDDAALILPALRAWIEWSQGRYGPISKPQAEWIVRIRRAAPDIPPGEAAIRAQGPARDLEAYLAWAPWRGPDHAAAYVDAFRRGWITTFVVNDWAEFPQDVLWGGKARMSRGHDQGHERLSSSGHEGPSTASRGAE